MRSVTRTSLVFLTALLSSRPALAQDLDRRGFIGLGIGPSTPIGSFSDASTAVGGTGNTVAGYTSTLVNLGYRFRDRLGVAVALDYSEYSVSGEGDDDWWQVAAVTVGPMYSVPMGSRAAVDFKAMLGMIVLTPVEDGFATVGGEGVGLGLDARATFRYDVRRRWAVFADAGFHYSGSDVVDYRALISGLGFAFRPMW